MLCLLPYLQIWKWEISLCCLVTKLCPTLLQPQGLQSPQTSLSMWFSGEEYWNGLPFPSPVDLPDPGIKPMSPAWQVDSLPLSHLGSPDQSVCCSVVQFCLTLCNPMDCSRPGSVSFTISQSLLKLMSIESVTPSKHFILCRPLLLLPSTFLASISFSISRLFASSG